MMLSILSCVCWQSVHLLWRNVALGLGCCMWAFSSHVEQGLLFLVVRGLLTVVASLVAEHGF